MTKRVPKYLCVIWFWHVQPGFSFLVSIIIWYFEHSYCRLCLYTRVEEITCKYACWRVSVRVKKSGEVSQMSTISLSGVLGPPLSPHINPKVRLHCKRISKTQSCVRLFFLHNEFKINTLASSVNLPESCIWSYFCSLLISVLCFTILFKNLVEREVTGCDKKC